MHPSMPFITETIWCELTGGESLVIAKWPAVSKAAPDVAADKVVGDMQVLITEIRRFRSEQGIKQELALKFQVYQEIYLTMKMQLDS
jgi:valyl-tRNA synthetase